MDFQQFLNTLENTLEKIEVHGRENLTRMLGCMQAIDKQRNYVTQRGEIDGRQTDIGTESGNDSNNS